MDLERAYIKLAEKYNIPALRCAGYQPCLIGITMLLT